MQTLKVLLKAANFCVSLVVILTMCAAGAFSVYALWDNSQVYRAAGDVQASMLHLKPQADPTAAEGPTFDELLAVNPDVCAWLTLDGTNIDYPVLQGESNLSYINTDVYGNFALAGSIFLDSRNSSTFADVFSLLYGHHMENSQMFGDLDKYRSVDFLQQTNTGTLLVPGGRYALRVFACIVVSASDDLIYQPLQWQADNVPAMLDRLQADALCVDQAAMDDLRTAQNLKVLCILQLFCKLFSHNTLHFLIQRFRSVISACDRVDRAADLFLQGELRQPESGWIFHTDVSILVKPEIVSGMVRRQRCGFKIGVGVGEVISLRLVMLLRLPCLDFCQKLRVDFMFKWFLLAHKCLLKMCKD